MLRRSSRCLLPAWSAQVTCGVASTALTSQFTLNKVDRCEDPSQAYISRPKEVPSVRLARHFFFELGMRNFSVHMGPVTGWRTAAKLAVRSPLPDIESFEKGSGRDASFPSPMIGLFVPGTHQVVESAAVSPAHHPSINAAVAVVRRACSECKIFGYVEGAGKADTDSDFAGFLKYVLFAVDRLSSKVQLSIVWNTSAPSSDDDKFGLTQRLSDKKLEEFKLVLMNQSQNSCPRGINIDSCDNLNMEIFHSIWVNYNPSCSSSNAITGRGGSDSWKLLHGPPHIIDRIDTDMIESCGFATDLYLPPFVFRQANLEQFTQVVGSIRTWLQKLICSDLIRDGGNKIVLQHKRGVCTEEKDSMNAVNHSVERKPSNLEELYCVELYGGIGTIGLNCIDLLQVLRCSDSNPFNKQCFDKSVAAMPDKYSSRASYVTADADVAAEELCSQIPPHDGYNVCIVDPPRKGLSQKVLDVLMYKPKHISMSKHHIQRDLKYLIYVSCGIKSFIRDANILLGKTQKTVNTGTGVKQKSDEIKQSNTWELIHAEGHILFPGSDHIETLAIFARH